MTSGFNVTIVAAPPTAAIFFLPLRLPTIAKAIDVDYIGSSNHAFFILRGAPGNHFTHADFVGYSDGQPDIPLVPGAPERILLHGKDSSNLNIVLNIYTSDIIIEVSDHCT